MRKIIFALVLLMLAAPASAEVLITAAQVGDGCDVIVSFANSEGQHVRAFALDIVVEASGNPEFVILGVECLSDDYYVYPGSIEITDNEVTNEGSCVCDDSYDDTLPGPPDSNGVTIEMASLYSPNDPDHNVAPADSGDLVKLTLSDCGGDITITITANELRGKVVMEDATSVEPNAPAGAATLPGCGCMDDEDPDYANWVLAGEPNCWCYDCYDCGDTDGDCQLTFADISTLINGWPPNPPDACADLDKDLSMTFGDISVLIANWPPNGACANCGACTPIP
jgi:hypothetical protein